MNEIRHPAVYLAELPFRSTPIEGVATSTAPLSAPAWTDANAHDPGLTLVETFAWLAELTGYRLHAVAGDPSSDT